ncbi:hypothetical protein GWI33_004229 [Rhynchophorus ferrugineus]|uniref:Uncharacterized protein n=1 Tax=Rhynchophorus ferrugineus TaxID=354439 RepID=A0A834IJ44_RHYFE|nr:hypothetical protein GWI33_004229 [Rhynchophorus ferrugineus]
MITNKYTYTLNETDNFKNNITQQGIPIYRTKFLDQPSKHINKVDLYEFDEDIPVTEKTREHCYKKSPRLLEEQEVIKCSKSKIHFENNEPIKKTYSNIVDGIVQNIMGKISKRKLYKNKKNFIAVNANGPVNHIPPCENTYKISNASVGDNSHQKSLDISGKQFNSLASPWRINWVTPRPIFISIKSNALPRIDQEMVMDHTFVESFEESCIKNNEVSKLAVIKPLIQQSILNYVNSNQIQDNSSIVSSLFNSEMFNNPVKNNLRQNVTMSNDNMKKDILVASTPVQNIPQNTSEIFKNDLTKRTLFNSDLDESEDVFTMRTNDFIQTPLKSCSAKKKNLNYKKNVYLSRDSRSNALNDEDILMTPTLGKKRRASFENDQNAGNVPKRFKKSKLEEEQESWIKKFNQECEDISNYDLYIE